jgi:hypothetical protein
LRVSVSVLSSMTQLKSRQIPKPRTPYEGPLLRWVSLEWSADYRAVQPLIEYILKRNSDSSGVWMTGEGIADAVWSADTSEVAEEVYDTLVRLCMAVKFAPYVRVRLMELLPGKDSAHAVSVWRRGKTPCLKLRRFRRKKRAA